MQFILTFEQIGAINAVISKVPGIILGLQSAKNWAKSHNAEFFLQYLLSAFDEEFIDSDVSEGLEHALAKETNCTARNQLKAILDNVSLARKNTIPMCQDTGIQKKDWL
ncbi:MAG: fumarate hydratase [Promethearchaeota archaeon]